MQTAGGVDEHQVTAALVGLIENVVAHTRGIGAAIALDNRNPCALPPHIELLDGGCSERVGAANNHIFAGMRSALAIFPTVVVLPAPLMPTNRTQLGVSSKISNAGSTKNSLSRSASAPRSCSAVFKFFRAAVSRKSSVTHIAISPPMSPMTRVSSSSSQKLSSTSPPK